MNPSGAHQNILDQNGFILNPSQEEIADADSDNEPDAEDVQQALREEAATTIADEWRTELATNHVDPLRHPPLTPPRPPPATLEAGNRTHAKALLAKVRLLFNHTNAAANPITAWCRLISIDRRRGTYPVGTWGRCHQCRRRYGSDSEGPTSHSVDRGVSDTTAQCTT